MDDDLLLPSSFFLKRAATHELLKGCTSTRRGAGRKASPAAPEGQWTGSTRTRPLLRRASDHGDDDSDDGGDDDYDDDYDGWRLNASRWRLEPQAKENKKQIKCVPSGK